MALAAGRTRQSGSGSPRRPRRRGSERRSSRCDLYSIGAGAGAALQARRPRRRGQFDGDCVEYEGFSLSDGDLHGWERRTWGTTNRVSMLYPRRGRRRWRGERNQLGDRRRRWRGGGLPRAARPSLQQPRGWNRIRERLRELNRSGLVEANASAFDPQAGEYYLETGDRASVTASAQNHAAVSKQRPLLLGQHGERIVQRRRVHRRMGSVPESLVTILPGHAVSDAALTPGGEQTIGVGAMSVGYGATSFGITYDATAVFDFTTFAKEEALDLTLLSYNSAGLVGFDSGLLWVDVDGNVHPYPLTSLSAAETFFAQGHSLQLGTFAAGPQSIEIEYSLTFNAGTSAASGDGFGFTYALEGSALEHSRAVDLGDDACRLRRPRLRRLPGSPGPAIIKIRDVTNVKGRGPYYEGKNHEAQHWTGHGCHRFDRLRNAGGGSEGAASLHCHQSGHSWGFGGQRIRRRHK